jgi:hypothetical protein
LKPRQPGVASHRAAQVMGVTVQHAGPPSGVTSRGTVVVLMAVYGSPQLTSGWWKYLTCDAVTRLMSFRRAGSGAACAGANTQSARATAARTVEAHSLPLRRAPPSRRGEPAQNHSVRARRRAWNLGCHARGRARRPHVSPFARSMALRVTTRCDARRGSAPGTAQVQEGRDVCWAHVSCGRGIPRGQAGPSLSACATGGKVCLITKHLKVVAMLIVTSCPKMPCATQPPR